MVNSDLIDREVNSLYSATLQARDQANNTGTTVLEITLTDINDQPPIIIRDFYNEFVKEGPGKDGELEISIFVSKCSTVPSLPCKQYFSLTSGKITVKTLYML